MLVGQSIYTTTQATDLILLADFRSEYIEARFHPEVVADSEWTPDTA
jgi:hypothetical protein